jgi:hypothetical protein
MIDAYVDGRLHKSTRVARTIYCDRHGTLCAMVGHNYQPVTKAEDGTWRCRIDTRTIATFKFNNRPGEPTT